MTENKKRKKLRITEGTGGDHAASVAAGSASGDYLEQKDVEVLPESRITWQNYQCPVCKGNFPSASAYGNHSCMK